MKEFNWENFRNYNIAVHCKTERECNDFLAMAREYGIVLSDSNSLSERKFFRESGNNICYRTEFKKCLRYDISVYYKAKGFTILEWRDYMKFTNEELRVGMLVETSFGKGIAMPSHSESVVVGSGGYWCSLDFEDVEKVWDYPDDPHFTLDCTGRYRKLLYERPTTKEMTVEEISKALGYKVKTVKG